MYRDTVLRKLPQLQVLDEARVSESGNEFYGVVRDTFDPDAELIFLEKPTWSKGSWAVLCRVEMTNSSS